jgi:hypothetical protein
MIDDDTRDTSKRAYYDADKVQALDEAKEEEAEALRLQKEDQQNERG